MDQIFVELKHWLVNWAPEEWRPLVSILVSVGAIATVFPLLFAVTSLLERKIMGRMQNRYGPNRVGPCGILQPVADGIKALTKEDLVPRSADWLVHLLAPVALVVPAFLAYAVLPVGRNMTAVDLDAGLLFFFAVGSSTELAVFMAGWSSRNKYSLLGAMRGIAQMISYELPLILATVPVVMAVGSLSLVQIVEAQSGWFGWHVFTPWGAAAFVMFLIAATAESNRSPFDMPEGESEIIAGYFIEYSGFKFALFFLGEYLGLFAISGICIALFLGGWQAPMPGLEIIPSWGWFFLKLLGFIFFFIWVRATMPRLRVDQLMNFAWKFMLPLALWNIVVVAVWTYMGPGPGRWVVCSAAVIGAYVGLGRLLGHGKRAERKYRFAD